MRMYETVLILHPEVNEERIQAVLAKMEGIVSEAGGKITEVDQWGGRKLAYRIAKQARGYYTVVKFASTPNIINELERNLKLAEDCIRFMTVNLEVEIDAQTLAGMEKVHKKPTATHEETAAEEAEEAEQELPEESESAQGLEETVEQQVAAEAEEKEEEE